MAHEIKNPLAGIRGAAQLLEEAVSASDRELAQLICNEADRIRALIDRMEAFGDPMALTRTPVNIHEVLDRVRQRRGDELRAAACASSKTSIRRCRRCWATATISSRLS